MLRLALHTAILTSASAACELKPVRLLSLSRSPVSLGFSVLPRLPVYISQVRLRTNNLDAPLGVPVHQPRLSWGFEATTSPPARGLAQAAYRIQAASQADSSAGSADIWDSGKVASSDSLEIFFGGTADILKPSQTVHWKVTVWYEGGPAEGCQSAPSVFETALAAGEAGWAGTQWLARYPPAPLNASGCELYDDRSERTQAPRFRSEVHRHFPLCRSSPHTKLVSRCGAGRCSASDRQRSGVHRGPGLLSTVH